MVLMPILLAFYYLCNSPLHTLTFLPRFCCLIRQELAEGATFVQHRYSLAYALTLIDHRILITDNKLRALLDTLEILIRILSRYIHISVFRFINHCIGSTQKSSNSASELKYLMLEFKFSNLLNHPLLMQQKIDTFL